jgi:hypothetical protein
MSDSISDRQPSDIELRGYRTGMQALFSLHVTKQAVHVSSHVAMHDEKNKDHQLGNGMSV